MEYNRLPKGSKYKYAVTKGDRVFCRILGQPFFHRYFELSRDGWLTIRDGYQWDGATCCPDNEGNIIPSCYHDAIYQAIRTALLLVKKSKKNRYIGDNMFKRLCIRHGTAKWLASIYYRSVRCFGWILCRPGNKKEQMEK